MKTEKCHCGGKAVLCGSDWTNEYGPWHILCTECGFASLSWAYIREARANFRSAYKKQEAKKINTK